MSEQATVTIDEIGHGDWAASPSRWRPRPAELGLTHSRADWAGPAGVVGRRS